MTVGLYLMKREAEPACRRSMAGGSPSCLVSSFLRNPLVGHAASCCRSSGTRCLPGGAERDAPLSVVAHGAERRGRAVRDAGGARPRRTRASRLEWAGVGTVDGRIARSSSVSLSGERATLPTGTASLAFSLLLVGRGGNRAAVDHVPGRAIGLSIASGLIARVERNFRKALADRVPIRWSVAVHQPGVAPDARRQPRLGSHMMQGALQAGRGVDRRTDFFGTVSTRCRSSVECSSTANRFSAKAASRCCDRSPSPSRSAAQRCSVCSVKLAPDRRSH